jgi:hypothetical protein
METKPTIEAGDRVADTAQNRLSMLRFAARVALMVQPGFELRVGDLVLDDASEPELHCYGQSMGVSVRPLNSSTALDMRLMAQACGSAYQGKVLGRERWGYSCHATQEEWEAALTAAIDEKPRAGSAEMRAVMVAAGFPAEEITAALSDGVVEHDLPAMQVVTEDRHAWYAEVSARHLRQWRTWADAYLATPEVTP